MYFVGSGFGRVSLPSYRNLEALRGFWSWRPHPGPSLGEGNVSLISNKSFRVPTPLPRRLRCVMTSLLVLETVPESSVVFRDRHSPRRTGGYLGRPRGLRRRTGDVLLSSFTTGSNDPYLVQSYLEFLIVTFRSGTLGRGGESGGRRTESRPPICLHPCIDLILGSRHLQGKV